jgi:hypothetical protein
MKIGYLGQKFELSNQNMCIKFLSFVPEENFVLPWQHISFTLQKVKQKRKNNYLRSWYFGQHIAGFGMGKISSKAFTKKKKTVIRDKRIISSKRRYSRSFNNFFKSRENVSLLMENSFVSEIITWKLCQICLLFCSNNAKKLRDYRDKSKPCVSVWKQNEKPCPDSIREAGGKSVPW